MGLLPSQGPRRWSLFTKPLSQVAWLHLSVCDKRCCCFFFMIFIIWENDRDHKSLVCLFFLFISRYPPWMISPTSGKSSSISLKSSDTNSSFSTVDPFQCPFSENHWQQFVQLIGDIENRIDASSFRELFWEEIELSNKMQDSISSGWRWLSQLLELSF